MPRSFKTTHRSPHPSCGSAEIEPYAPAHSQAATDNEPHKLFVQQEKIISCSKLECATIALSPFSGFSHTMDYSELAPELLVSTCIGRSSSGAWEEFIRRFHPVIAGVVAKTAGRAGINDVVTVEDLVQEILLKICTDDCRLLRQFASRAPGSIFSYLKVIAINHVRDRFRSELTRKRHIDSPILDSLADGNVIDSRWTVPRIEQTVLLTEVETGLEMVLAEPHKDRDRAIFFLYYQQGFTAPDIAALDGINLTVKGVESALARLTRLLRQHFEVNEGKSA